MVPSAGQWRSEKKCEYCVKAEHLHCLSTTATLGGKVFKVQSEYIPL